MAATRTCRTCRKCGKERDIALYTTSISSCDVCRLTALVASSPGSTVYKTQLKKACERAGEAYADACTEAMDGCTTSPQRLRNKTAQAKAEAAKRQALRSELKKQRAMLDDLHRQVDELTREAERLATELAEERNAAAHSRALALENTKLRSMNILMGKDLRNKRKAVTAIRKAALKLARENRALKAERTICLP